MSDEIYFISDAHLGSQDPRTEREKEARLCAFLRALRDRATMLYIVGDFFDFWFEYRSAVPRIGGKALFELYHLAASGTRIAYLGGNHDFWLGSYLSEVVGLQIHREPVGVEHGGLRIYVAHGDEFMGNTSYRWMRAVLHHPLSVRLFRSLHPDWGAVLARWASRASGEANVDRDLSVFKKRYIQAAQEKLDEGFDAVVFGHLHAPFLWERDGKTFIVLGDWVRHFSYAMLREGRFSLLRWEEGGRSLPIRVGDSSRSLR